MNSPPVRKIAIRAAFILFGLSLSLVAGEIGIRLIFSNSIASSNPADKQIVSIAQALPRATYHKPGEQFVYFGNPGALKEFEIAGRWNAQGFNDKDYSFHKASNTFRIVVLGDSYVEALQVPMERSFHKVLERSLNQRIKNKNFEVISFGASGNGPRKNLQCLEKLGMKYGPDLVIMMFLEGNDVRDDNVALQVLHRRQKDKLEKLSPTLYRPTLYQPGGQVPHLLRYSRLFGFLAQSSLNLKYKRQRKELTPEDQIPLDQFIYSTQYDQIWKRAWQNTLSYVRQAEELVVSGKSDFILVEIDEVFRLIDHGEIPIFDNPAMKKYSWDFDRPRKIIKEFCRDNQIRLLDLEPFFADENSRSKTPLHYAYDGHWNEKGHELAAETIFNYLKEQTLLQ